MSLDQLRQAEQQAWAAVEREPSTWAVLTAVLATAARQAAEGRRNG